MKKSATVTLAAVAAMGVAARGQQPADPCETATFNGKVCQAAVRHHGYCSQGTWMPMTYQNSYPYYYDLYRDYIASGSSPTAVPAETCRRPHGFWTGAHAVRHGGFGSTHAGHRAGG